MNTGAKTFAAMAAVAAMTVGFRGTAQALPTTDSVPNYNFQNWDRWEGGIYFGNPTATTSPTATYTSMRDGYMTQSGGGDYGTPSYWYMAGDATPTFVIWNPTSSGSTVVATDPATGAVTPATYLPPPPILPPRPDPASWYFNFSDGNGSLPGTAAGPQCLANISSPEYDSSALVPGNQYDLNAPGGGSVGFTTLALNKLYTMTTACAQPMGSSYNNGFALMFYDATNVAYSYNEVIRPPGATSNANGWVKGIFQDVSYTVASNDALGIGVNVGDAIDIGISAGPGTCWSNVRFIEQNWFPMYTSAASGGSVEWTGGTSWSTAELVKNGGTRNTAWVNGKDAVFEPWQDGGGNWQGGTVTVSGPVSANSINFYTSMDTANYTIQSGNGSAITLTGDAIVNVGAGTGFDITTDVGGETGEPLTTGGGTATIACTLTGTNGLYKAGSGTLILTGSNTYQNNADHTKDTTVGGGTLQIGAGGNTGSITGNVYNLAHLAFNRDNYVYGGTISGTGYVTIMGGTTVFSADHTYTGLTEVAGGILQIGNGGSTGSIVGDIVLGDLTTNGATTHGNLVFNRSTSLSYAGKIYGTGGVTQAGTGRIILTGANTYTGQTVVQAGGAIELGVNAQANVLTNGADIQNTATSVCALVFDYSGSDASLLATIRSDLKNGVIKDTLAGDIIVLSGGTVTLGYLDTGSSVIVEPMLAGDANHDGMVNASDLAALGLHWKQINPTWAAGDFNYDGTVNASDLAILGLNWNKAWSPSFPSDVVGLPGLGSTVTAVPEPGSFVLLALAVLAGSGAFRISLAGKRKAGRR
jgi:autotransporter-associated beta strand protein